MAEESVREMQQKGTLSVRRITGTIVGFEMWMPMCKDWSEVARS